MIDIKYQLSICEMFEAGFQWHRACRIILMLLSYLFLSNHTPAFANVPTPPPPSTPSAVSFEPEYRYLITAVASDGSWVAIAEDKNAGPEHPAPRSASLSVPPELRELVKQYQAGDRILARSRPDNLVSLRPQKVTVEPRDRLIALGFPIAALLVLYAIFKVRRAKFSCLVLGLDCRYSNSKLQMAIWFFIVSGVYVATYCLRAWYGNGTLLLGPGIPQNIALLSGFSVASFCGAKAITSSKIEREVASIEANVGGCPAPPPPLAGESFTSSNKPRFTLLQNEAEARVKPPANSPKLFNDLFEDDRGHIDLGDTQMLAVTALAATVYFYEAYQWLGAIDLVQQVSLPDIDSTILTLFGLGQGGYLLKKRVGNGA